MYKSQRYFVETLHKSPDPLRAVAMLRARMHAGNGVNFQKAYDRHYVGLKGEEAFATAFKQPLVFWDQPGGDHGEDFWVVLFLEDHSFSWFSVDVKTARHPSALIVPEGKVRADVYVLAAYDDETDRAALVGWQWGAVVRKASTRKFATDECHYCTEIRPLGDLAFNAFRLWENGPPNIPTEWETVRLVSSH